MSKYVECTLDVTLEEFISVVRRLGLTEGKKVRMYSGVYDCEASADNLVGWKDGKLLFDDMYGGRIATQIVEKVYTDRIVDRFGPVDIGRIENGREVILTIRR